MTRTAIVLAVLFTLSSTVSMGAGFDCSKAATGLEKELCTDAGLGRADEALAKYYFKLRKSIDAQQAKELLEEQRTWLKQREILCPEVDPACLKKLYDDRIQALRVRYENIVPFDVDLSGEFQGMRGTCGFPDVGSPDDYAVYATGWYSGRKLDIQIDQSGHEANLFEIIVNSPGKPVVLILGAYEPSIWKIGWTKETVILAAVATGYHRQAVAGLPKDTPILISTSENGDLCHHVYPDGKNQAAIDDFSKSIFHKPTDKTYLAGDGKALLGSPVRPGEQFLTSADTPVERFMNRKAPLAGPVGLKDALKKGVLRIATQEDRERWIMLKTRKACRKSKTPPRDPYCAGIIPVRPAGEDEFYVILKPFHLPNGLYGGNSADFFLPEGVPFPKGDLGHCHLYDFNTMKCHGPVCEQPDCN